MQRSSPIIMARWARGNQVDLVKSLFPKCIKLWLSYSGKHSLRGTTDGSIIPRPAENFLCTVSSSSPNPSLLFISSRILKKKTSLFFNTATLYDDITSSAIETSRYRTKNSLERAKDNLCDQSLEVSTN